MPKAPTTRFDVARSRSDLEGILALQGENLEAALDAEEVQREGFLTLRHDLGLLDRMGREGAHVVARAGDGIVGYALFLHLKHEGLFPGLRPMMNELARFDLGRTFIMGQVCVARSHRGQGVFEGLYGELRKVHAPDFGSVVTEVAHRNVRSLRAYEKVGFERLVRYAHGDGSEWEIIRWDWC